MADVVWARLGGCGWASTYNGWESNDDRRDEGGRRRRYVRLEMLASKLKRCE